jgi:hypothetical protein
MLPDVEMLVAQSAQQVQQFSRSHSVNWNRVNATLMQKAPRLRNWETCFHRVVGGVHVAVKIALLFWVCMALLNIILARFESRVELLVNIFLLVFISVNICINFYKCFMLENTIPDSWVAPDDLHDGGRCVLCKRVRPARSHHCTSCGCCQLRRDHHCHWISNCVGYFNYAYFVSLTFWDAVLAAYTFYHTHKIAADILAFRESSDPVIVILLSFLALFAMPVSFNSILDHSHVCLPAIAVGLLFFGPYFLGKVDCAFYFGDK